MDSSSFLKVLEDIDTQYQKFKEEYQGLSYTWNDLFTYFHISPYYSRFLENEKVLESAYQVRLSKEYDFFFLYMKGLKDAFAFSDEFLENIRLLDSFDVDFAMVEPLAILYNLKSLENSLKK